MGQPFRTASPSSKAVSTLRSLTKKRNRDETGLAVVEGPSAVEYALRIGVLLTLFCDDDAFSKFNELIAVADARNVEILRLETTELAKLADTRTPQGLIGTASCLISQGAPPDSFDLVVILDGVQDPGNVGTIIRSADAFGGAVVVGPQTADPRSAKVVRASAGSVFGTDIFATDDVLSVLAVLSDRGAAVYAADASGSPDFFRDHEGAQDSAIVWVLGNEASGVSAPVARACAPVSIPMVGAAESLNVGAAATVCLYESRRKLG